MKRLRLLFALIFALTAWGQEPTVTLNGSNYTLQPHPRVFLNSAINSRVAYNGGLAPKATSSNPAWSALTTRAAHYYNSYGSPGSSHNFDTAYQDGTVAALYAQYWYSDNSQTTYLNAALYLLNNMQQYVSLVCNEGVKDCVNGGNGYWNGSYGPAYYMPNWIYAYELVRSQMTATQQQTFADKWLNDSAQWGGTGLGGSSSTSCTNPTLVGTTSVSISSTGAVTASAPYFGSGQTLQVGDWIYESNSDIGAVIASVTDSEHATIESDVSMSGYSGTLFTRRGGWQAGDCGWFWLQKHDWFSPYSIIQTTTGYASPDGAYGGYGGIDGASGSDNHVLAATYGLSAALFSLADDDVNFSARTSPELTALYNYWYKNSFLGQNEFNYTGFTPTGSVYGLWRAYTFYPLTALEITNSVVSPPPLTSGLWAKNIAHHFYLATFPACPAEEQEYGQSFQPASSYNNYLGWVPGLAGLITMYQGTDEGEYLNYWMQNLWSTCTGYTGNTPGTNLMWNASALSASASTQSWFYLYTDPAFPTNSSLPTGSVDNCSDAGCSGAVPTTTALPMAGMISRTGYSSITDTLVNFYALATTAEDHSIPEGGQWNPADYRIFKGNYLLGDDWPSNNAGGPMSMAMEIGGDTNITGTGTLPFVVLMPAGANDSSNRYTYALVDSTKSYVSGAQASAVERYLVHFKKPGTQDFVVVYDYVATAAGEQKQTYLHYAQKSSTSLSGNTITSSFAGTGHSDATQLLSQVLAPQGANSVYTYTNNSNGTYSGGNGDTYRVSLCASSTGTSCSTTNTVGEFAVVHEPVAGSSNSLPATEMLSTIDASHRGIEIDGASPKVAVFPIGPSEPTFTTATFTTAHPGTAQYLVAGLAPGTYNVTLNGAAIVTGAAVSAGNNSLYFESAAGAIVVSQTGAATLTGITVSPATASLVVGSGTQSYTATCAYSNGTSSTCTTTVTWSSSNTAAATITSAGVATGVAAGTATITAGSGGVTGTSTLTVTSPSLSSISLSPSTASVAVGGTQQLTATCYYSNNTNSACASTVTWSSSSPGTASVSGAGLVTGIAAGTTIITATSGGQSATGALTVTAPTTTSIAISPATATIAAGSGTQQYTATCTSSNGTTSNCTSTVTWSSGNPATATISSAGLATGVAAGTSTISATSGSVQGSSILTVTGPAVSSIAVSPATASIASGTGTQQYTATCSYSNSTTSNCTSTVTWSSSSPAAATIAANGLATGVASGTTTITATSGSVSGTSSLTVTNPTLTSIALSPSTASIAAGSGTQQLTATCYYANNTNSNCSTTVTWSSSSTAAATVSAAGLVTGVAAGTSTITAASGTISATSVMTVTANALSAIAITPATASIAASGTQQYSATCTYANGSTAACPATMTWTSSSATIATISSSGLATGVAAGATTITAVSGTIKGTSNLTVTAAPLNSITVTPATATVVAGLSMNQYKATCNFANSTSTDCTATVNWSSNNPLTAKITSPGVVLGVAIGTAKINATSAGTTGSSMLTVTPPALTGISIGPATASIVAGTGTEQYTATCSYSNATSSPCTSTVTWSSSNASIATVNNAGLATGVAVGSATITATSGSTSTTSVLTVINPALTSIAVMPGSASIVTGTGTEQFTATCSYANNSSSTCTTTVKWTSSNKAVASISAGGLATGVGNGTATITATSGAVSGTGTITVSSPALTGITVTPGTATVQAGTGTQQFTATCAYANSTTTNCTSDATWSSSSPATAVITGNGVATGVAPGTAVLTAAFGGLSGSATVTVSNPSLTAISVTPSTASISAAAGTQQYAASCTYSDASVSTCTSTVTWSSSNNVYATISASGLATGVSAGTVTITATSGSTSGSSTLTVEASTPPASVHRGKWSWMDGSSSSGGTLKAIPGVMAELNTPSASNTPGGRDGSVTWTDQGGNLWLFGGGGFDASGNSGYLNDLWEFTPTTMEWAWVGGSSTVPAANQGRSGVYSTVGSASTEAIPGGRQASVSWTDASGNLWLFGGEGFDSSGVNGDLNDLWKYAPSSQEWTWVGGSSTVPAAGKGRAGVYGTLGAPAQANIPGGRWGANSWTDANGNLWLFGGVGFDSTGASGSLNDLWQFNASTAQWAWMAGSSTVGSNGGQYGVYGTLGTAASGNTPSSRNQAVTWTDQSGNLWLFGGYGFDSTGTWGYLNDLWQFNLSSHQWAWMGGSNTVGCAGCGQAGVYGTVGTRDSSSQPGGRNQAVGWSDSSGNLWMFGGVGFDSKGVNGDLNDLWEYVLSSGEWAWVGGSSTVPASGKGQPGNYGSRGVPANSDNPGGRWSSGAWTDPKGDLWLFGGAGYDANGNYDNLNDLWVYQPDPGTLATATPTLSIGSGTYTGAQSITIADQIPGATIYYTTDGTAPSTGSAVYTGPITVGAAETLQAIALASGYGPSGLASANYTIVAPFSLGLGTGASSITVYPGGTANFNLILTPVGGNTFPAAITFTATGLPPGATATFSPSTVNAGSGLTGVTFAVQTQSEGPAAAMLHQPGKAGSLNTGTLSGLLCLLFLPLAAVARWRKTAKHLARHASLMIWLLILAGITAAVTGCGGGASLNSNAVAAPAASYNITITAKSGALQKTATVTVNIR